MKSLLFILAMGIMAITLPHASFAAEGNLLLLTANGTNLSSLNVSVIPGLSNVTSFRISAQGENISNVAIFYLGQFNVTVSPANVSLLPAGDSVNVAVTVAIGNQTEAGNFTEKLILLTSKPESLEIPLRVDVPETTGWGIVGNATNITRTVGRNEAGKLGEIRLQNYGNVQVNGRMTVVDLADLVWLDESNFTLDPQETLTRPIYFAIPNGTLPGSYPINVSFFDALNNVRRMNITLVLPDDASPVLNISVLSVNLTTAQKIRATVKAKDEINISRVWGQIDAGGTFFFDYDPDALTWKTEQGNLTVGQHNLIIFANDTSNNNVTQTVPFTVAPFDLVEIRPAILFYRFKPGQERSEVIMKANESVSVDIKLARLTVPSPNTTIALKIGSSQMLPGEQRSFNFTGELRMTIIGDNNTDFDGLLEISASPDILIRNPTISFSGAIGNYSVSQPTVMTIAGVRISCTPNDVGVYENSSYVCASTYPIDIDTSDMSVTIPKTTYDGIFLAHNTEMGQCKSDLSGSRTLNWGFLLIVILLIAAVFIKIYVIDRGHFRLEKIGR